MNTRKLSIRKQQKPIAKTEHLLGKELVVTLISAVIVAIVIVGLIHISGGMSPEKRLRL